jgi:hypothetical protein
MDKLIVQTKPVEIKVLKIGGHKLTKSVFNQIPVYDGLWAIEKILGIDEHDHWGVNLDLIGYVNQPVNHSDASLTRMATHDWTYPNIWEKLSTFLTWEVIKGIPTEEYVYILCNHSRDGLSKVAIPKNLPLIKSRMKEQLDQIYIAT